MTDWSTLRVLTVIAVWSTVAGGALMAILWTAYGGLRAVGPEDEIAALTGQTVEVSRRRTTSLSSAQVGMHGMLGVLTASFVTYAVLFSDDRTTAYVGLLVALVVTAVPGVLMVHKWRTGRRPLVGGDLSAKERVEDHLHPVVVLLHGAAALTTGLLVVVLLLLD